MEFKDRLAVLLKTNSLTQKELAGRIGLRKSLISEWKRNNSYPYADVAVKISIILGVTAEYLITGEDSLSPGERELLAAYKQLNPAGKQAAAAAIKGLAAGFPANLR